MRFNFDIYFYVDNSAFIFLWRNDIKRGGKQLIQSHFKKFALTIHTGIKTKNNDKSNWKQCFLPGQEEKKTRPQFMKEQTS